jgi:hypothetical protein
MAWKAGDEVIVTSEGKVISITNKGLINELI